MLCLRQETFKKRREKNGLIEEKRKKNFYELWKLKEDNSSLRKKKILGFKKKIEKKEKETVDTHTDHTPLHQKEKKEEETFLFLNRTNINLNIFSELFGIFFLVVSFCLDCHIFTLFVFLEKKKFFPNNSWKI